MENSNISKFIALIANKHKYFHPAGNPRPSIEDRKLTRKIVAIFESMGIRVFDHIMIGKEDYYSFREEGDLDTMKVLPKMSDYTATNLGNVSDMELEPE